MKRFDDLLRMLSSILFGLLIKDAQKLFFELSNYLNCCGVSPGWCKRLAVAISVLIIVGFFRNIHGSFQYDALLEDTSSDLRPAYEKCIAGRFCGFFATVVTLVAVPLCVLMIEWGFLSSSSVSHFIFILFFPYGLYLIYDSILVCSLDANSPIRYPALGWLWLHITLAIGFLFCLPIFSQATDSEDWRALLTELIARVYIVAALIQIIGDYYLNRHFYFPDRA